MNLINKITTRHIVLAVGGACFGALVRGPIVGVIGGFILGLCIAEITYMIDSMRK